LAELKNLTINQVNRWLMNQRVNLKKKRSGIVANRSTTKQKEVLNNFFGNKATKPNKNQIDFLSREINLSEKKLLKWFTKERFRKKCKNK
jgi:hypothetical protein